MTESSIASDAQNNRKKEERKYGENKKLLSRLYNYSRQSNIPKESI